MRTTFINELTKNASKKDNIFLLTADVGYNVIEEFADNFPDRYLNVGVAEQNMTGIAAGLASEGYHVFIYSIANFPTFRSAEQIRNDIDYHNLSVTIVSVGAGVSYGNLGYSHHAIQDYGLIRMMPNFIIAAPGDPYEVKGVLNYLIKNPQPSYLRLGKSGEFNYSPENKIIKPGAWSCIKPNNNSTKIILTSGTALQWVMSKKNKLNKYNVYSLPLWGMKYKKQQSNFTKKWSAIYTVEVHLKDCGFGSWFAESHNKHELSNKEIRNYYLPETICNKSASHYELMKNIIYD